MGEPDFPMVFNFGDGSTFEPEIGVYYQLENNDVQLGTFTFRKARGSEMSAKCELCALASVSHAPCGQIACTGRDGMIHGCYAVLSEEGAAPSVADEIAADSDELERQIADAIDAAQTPDDVRRIVNVDVARVFSQGAKGRLTDRAESRLRSMESDTSAQHEAKEKTLKPTAKTTKLVHDFIVRMKRASTHEELQEVFAAIRKKRDAIDEDGFRTLAENAEFRESELNGFDVLKAIDAAQTPDDLKAVAAQAENEKIAPHVVGPIRCAIAQRRADLERKTGATNSNSTDLESSIRRVVEETLTRFLANGAVPSSVAPAPAPDPDVEELETSKAELDALNQKVATLRRKVKSLESKIMKRAIAANRPTPLLELCGDGRDGRDAPAGN